MENGKVVVPLPAVAKEISFFSPKGALSGRAVTVTVLLLRR
jgi:hypothetical protein